MMTSIELPPLQARRKAGRPATLNRTMIAEAAHEVGLEGLTLRAVADHLNVSISALYHYVDGRDDLMRAAAERSAQAVPLPVYRGQHWAQWLSDWAHYNYAVFTTQPGLLGQYLEGAISTESVVHNLDAILGVLVAEGFTIGEANDAYRLTSACALGLAIGATRHNNLAEQSGTADAYRKVLSETPRGQLANIRRLQKERKTGDHATFERDIELMLRGVGTAYNIAWKPIVQPTKSE
jgi:AcrR family transcriptional regulator